MAEISQNVNIEMLEKLPDGTYKRKYPATKAEVVKLVDAQNKFTNKNVEGAMSELFTNVSSGKDLVGGAITDVDDSVVIPTDPSFSDLASAIGQISTGKKWASGEVYTSSTYFSVSGLSFKPSLVFAQANDAGYSVNVAVGISAEIKADTDNTDLVLATDGDGNPKRLFKWGTTESSFEIEVVTANKTYKWVAFE